MKNNSALIKEVHEMLAKKYEHISTNSDLRKLNITSVRTSETQFIPDEIHDPKLLIADHVTKGQVPSDVKKGLYSFKRDKNAK